MGKPIVIVGGGIAGLSAALALDRLGHSCIVLEARSEAARDGAGVQIGPNGVAALRRLGLDEALRARASVPDSIRVHDGAPGRLLTALPLGSWIAERHGAPYWVVHRADLLDALQTAVTARGVDTRYASAVVETRDTPGAPSVTLRDGTHVDAKAIIGADGVWSAVRRAHFDAAPPLFAGRAAARALVNPADVPWVSVRDVSVWLAPGAHVVAYPVNAGARLNVVVIAPVERADAETWSAVVSRDDIMQRVAAFAAPVRDLIGAAPAWRQWPLMTHAALPPFSHGEIALMGDAAHPMLPFLAQGAVMALEDALALAAAVDTQTSDIAGALQAYSSARLQRTQRVVETAAQQGRVYHVAGPMKVARDLALRVTPPTVVMMRYDWLYGAR